MATSRRIFKAVIVVASAIGTALVATAIRGGAPTTQAAGAALLPPLATAPQVYPKATLVPVPYRPFMPPATVSHAPRLLVGDAMHPLRGRPAMDRPPLCDSAQSAPAEAHLSVGPPIRLVSPDSSAIPVATIAARPDAAKATLATDPTVELAPPSALTLTPPSRTTPPPPQLLSIPDPSHQTGFISTPAPSVEDPPATSIDRPGPTTLPVGNK